MVSLPLTNWPCFSSFDHKRWWYKKRCSKVVVLLGQSCYLSEQSTNEKGFTMIIDQSQVNFHVSLFDCKSEK